MRVVIDTNVLVSALLKAGSVPDRALDAIWRDATVLYDEAIFEEYRAVLQRPKFAAAARPRVDAILTQVRARGVALIDVPSWDGPLPDPDDRIFVRAALAGRADAIVTGNLKDYPTGLGFEVWPPAIVLAALGG